MSLSSNATEPSVYGLGGSGGLPSQKNVTITYPVAASASLSQGDWVVLSSTITGVITKCTDTADNAIGVVGATLDNSSGADGDLFAPVLRQGFAYVDARLSSSGAVCGKAINFDDLLYLSATAAYNPTEGQTLTSTNGGTLVARACDSVVIAATTAATLAKIRVYLDRLSKSALLV